MNTKQRNITMSKGAFVGLLSIAVASVAITSYLAVAISTGQTSAVARKPSEMMPVRAASSSSRVRLEDMIGSLGDQMIKLEAAQVDTTEMGTADKPAFTLNNLEDYRVKAR